MEYAGVDFSMKSFWWSFSLDLSINVCICVSISSHMMIISQKLLLSLFRIKLKYFRYVFWPYYFLKYDLFETLYCFYKRIYRTLGSAMMENSFISYVVGVNKWAISHALNYYIFNTIKDQIFYLQELFMIFILLF